MFFVFFPLYLFILQTFRLYIGGHTGGLEEIRQVVFFLHGGGHSAMSWAIVSV